MITFMEIPHSKPAIWDVFSEEYKHRDIKREAILYIAN